MPLRESESIILKTYNLSEADRIVVLFTRDFGMVRGVAKGARRLKSRFGSTLEPFSEVKVEYFEKEERELVSLQHTDLIRSSFDIASDPESLETYAYIADLLIEFAPPHDPNETLYRMVRAVLSARLTQRPEHAALKLYSEIWVLRLGGFLPDWSRCSVCRRTLDPSETAVLGEAFQLICGTCKQERRAGIAVSPTHRSLVSDAQSKAPNEFLMAAANSNDLVSELRDVMGRIVATATGRPLTKAKKI
jgi:DNA repair protein RecO (recombination protein O)